MLEMINKILCVYINWILLSVTAFYFGTTRKYLFKHSWTYSDFHQMLRWFIPWLTDWHNTVDHSISFHFSGSWEQVEWLDGAPLVFPGPSNETNHQHSTNAFGQICNEIFWGVEEWTLAKRHLQLMEFISSLVAGFLCPSHQQLTRYLCTNYCNTN